MFQVRKKINLRRYFISTVLIFSIFSAISYYLKSDFSEFPALFYICIATIVNQMMLIYAVKNFFYKNNTLNQSAIKKLFNILVWPLKTLILFHAFYIGIQTVGDKVIIPLVFYIIQVFILLVNINKQENSGMQPV